MKHFINHRCQVALFFIFFMLFFMNKPGRPQIIARGLGLGHAYTALARGVHAPLYNPANLGLPGNPKFSMTFLSAGIGVRNNSFSKGDYDRYLVDDPEWDQNDIENILSRIPDDGFQLHNRSTVRVLSFSIKRFAFTFGAETGGFLNSDKNLFRLSLQGNELNRTYRFNNMDGSGVAVGILGISWGQPIQVSFAEAFSVGASINFLHGITSAQVDEASGSLTTHPYGFEVKGDYKASLFSGKTGVNLDIGTAAQFGKNLTVSLALANLVGFVSWSTDETSQGFLYGDSLTIYKIADEEEEAIEDSSWTLKGGRSFSRKLPLIIRLGSAYKIKRFTFTADYVQSFSQNAWVSKKPQLAFGIEWQGLGWLPFRTGIVTGGKLGFGTSFGLGFRPGGFIFDISIMNGGFVFPKNAKGFVVALDLGMEFN